MSYSEEDYLLISGIQHYDFCSRQWALIYIEEQWNENYLTTSGRILHEKVHSGGAPEKRDDIIIFRSLKVSSSRLGISGECDVVEFHRSENGITLIGYDDLWVPYPIEYKRGKTKIEDCDRLQLCAQAVCLEEMLCCRIDSGALYYGETRRRESILFSDELRSKLEVIIETMHSLFSKQYTPKVKNNKKCISCSIKDVCLPKLLDTQKNNVTKYFEDNLE